MANMEKIRHSLAHIMALAVQELFPNVKFGIGPAIENGFYYDFDFSQDFSGENLSQIEEKMKEIIEKDVPFRKKEVSKEEAEKIFKNQPYKLELISELEGKKVSIYESGNFIDLCQGPHIKSTKEIPLNSFKLDKVAGAYWRGTEENKMLTRIYGLAFESANKLNAFLKMREEAENRDHRKLGKELGLFLFDDEVGQGLPIWLPKGAWIKKIVMDFAFDTYLENGYQPVFTPHIASNKLWKHSGHVEFYKEALYGEFKVEKESYRVKPMNCPFHVAIYKNKTRSYRDLPFRLTEMGDVYRYEKSGTLHGLTRVRGFTQDDAHIICTPEQIENEIRKAFELTLYILGTFGFKEFEVNLSVRDPEHKKDFIGSDKQWKVAEDVLENVIKNMGYGDKYIKDVGGAVFYGPKIDIKVKDSIGRKWQLSTLQFDFNLPKRFDMKYIGADGQEHTPYMVHRALLGSLERFIGVLIEHYAGAFPLWLSPVQIAVIPVGENNLEYAQKIEKLLKKKKLRVVVEGESETVGKKIRNAELQKIPYMLIIGEKEEKKKSVAVRDREDGDLGQMELKTFIKKVEKEIKNKK